MRLFLLISVFMFGSSPVWAQRLGQSGTAQAFAQQAQALREIQRSLMTLSARVEAIEQQQSLLVSRLGTLERSGNPVTKDELAALRADLNTAKASHAQLREAIVDDLSKRIAALAEKRDMEERKAREAAAQRSGYNHTVEAGQTLSAIAKAYGVSQKAIMQANRLTDASKLRVGQKLFIPDP